jgi:GNAT superfamily N-acetyltransferase
MPKMIEHRVHFFMHPQESAISSFLPVLFPHLPHSNPIYNRLQAPHNLPSRHCIFAATFPTSTNPPECYTILFADRSRHLESQIWIFNPLITLPSLSTVQEQELKAHLEASIYFLKNTPITEASGWPFSPILKYACLHEHISSALFNMGTAKDAVPYISRWNLWILSTSSVSSNSKEGRGLPKGYTVALVPEDQLDIVIATSTIPRQASTLLLLPSVGLLNEEGKLVAWGYIGIDGSFATLYVLPDQRGKGLASRVAVELLTRLDRGGFQDLGFDGSSGWVHADVKVGNKESEGVMKSLGGSVGWESSYMWIDSEKF